MRSALTIAGSDSIAGAGIQADLKTFAAFGVYGTSAITAVTSQNSVGVREVFPLPPGTVRSQIAAVVEDVHLSAIKTGMLATVDIVAAVAEMIQIVVRSHGPAVIVDPVMRATNPGGGTLLAPDAVSTMKSLLFPLATVVTPNLEEAGTLAGIAVDSMDAAREAARKIVDLGAGAVLIKGGHMAGPMATDLLFDGRQFTEFSAPRSPIVQVHGTGCALASALGAAMANGDGLGDAVQRAKDYVTGAIAHAHAIGKGSLVLDHFWNRDLPQPSDGPGGPGRL